MSEITLQQALATLAGLTHRFTHADLNNEGWGWRDYRQVRYAFLQTYQELRQLGAVLIMERPSRQPVTVAHVALAQSHAAYRAFTARFISITDHDLDLDPGPSPDWWPLRRILGHAIIVERTYAAVIQHTLDAHRSGQTEPAPLPETVEDAVAAEVETAVRGALTGTLNQYEEIHNQILLQLADIADAELELPTYWWEEQPYPIRFRLHRFDTHLREHGVQVDRTLRRLDRPPNEASRLLAEIYNALAQVEAVSIGAPRHGVERRYALARRVLARVESVTKFMVQNKFYS